MDVFERLIPVLTFIAGLVGAGVLEWRRDRRQATLARAAADRAAAKEDARYAREFERDTLLAVEDALNDLGRVSAELNYEVCSWVLDDKPLAGFAPSDALSEQERLANLELNRLRGRLRREELHEALRCVRSMFAVAAHPHPDDEIHDLMLVWQQADVAGVIAQELLSERLRELIYGDAGPPRQLGDD